MCLIIFFRLCGDRPVFDLLELNSWLTSLENQNIADFDLVTNYSEGMVKGLTTELISTKSLVEISKYPFLTISHKEHVTNYFYDFSSKFKIIYFPSKFTKIKFGSLAIDTFDDYNVMSKFFDLYPDVSVSTTQAINYLGLNK